MIPQENLPTEAEVISYLNGRRVGVIMDYRARIARPRQRMLGPAEAWHLFLDGLRQMGLVNPGEPNP